jgi:glyoxylase-like metal-dependent hydrolase (beta-lactamase superfamily II)
MHAQRISATSLLEAIDAHDDLVVLDVREPDEFASWSISGAMNIPLSELEAHVADVPTAATVVTVCAVGSRASTATEVLASRGVASLVLDGGMAAWSRAYDEAELAFDAATVVQVRRRGKGCLSYLVGSGDAAVAIDPSSDTAEYIERAAARGWTITAVLDTHLHADHVSGARALALATGARLLLNPADHFAFAYEPLVDGMQVAIGEGVALSVAVVHSPGHTMGSTVFMLGDDAVMTGDTLFLESVGRPDLADKAEAFAHALYASLHDRILVLPDTTLVCPAHVSGVVDVTSSPVAATVGSLTERLWQLRCDEDEFVAWAAGSVTARPPHYATIVAANQQGTDLDAASIAELEAGPNRCAVAT